MKHLPDIDPLDLMAVLGVLLVAIAIELRLGADIAIGWVGACLLVYCILAARNSTPEAQT